MNISPAIQSIARKFLQAGYQIFLVGGVVRDMILQRPLSDYDMSTDALPAQIMQLFPRAIPTGLAHGTITVIWKGLRVEITTLRAESDYKDHRHPEQITFGSSIIEDLHRRDFTMNAIAIDLNTHHIIDPCHGQADIHRKTIRTVGDSYKRFEEDALRMLRAVRFVAQLGFTIEASTLSAIRQTHATLSYLAKERIHDELLKLLTSPMPSEGMRLLIDSNLTRDIFDIPLRPMQEWQDRLNSIPGKYPMLRLALLIYETETSHSEKILQWMITFRFANKDQKDLQTFCLSLQTFPSPHAQDRDLRVFLSRAGKEYLAPLIHLFQSLPHDQLPTDWEERLRQQADMPLTLSELAIDGRTIMREYNVPRGKTVGKILHYLLDEVLADPTVNTEKMLKEKTRQWMESC